MSATKSILVINPNSSESVTDGLRETLTAPPECTLVFYTAPSHAPPSINDVTTAALTASACWEDIRDRGLLDQYDAFLVSCCTFIHLSLLPHQTSLKLTVTDLIWLVNVESKVSDHPLIHILREQSTKPIIGIFEAAIVTALLTTRRFGILTTGTGFKFLRSQEVHKFMGGNCARYVGVVTTGLGVVELREGDRDKVEKNMKEGAGRLAGMGADAVLLGCAGECFSSSFSIRGCLGRRIIDQLGMDGCGYRHGWNGAVGSTRRERSRPCAGAYRRWRTSWRGVPRVSSQTGLTRLTDICTPLLALGSVKCCACIPLFGSRSVFWFTLYTKHRQCVALILFGLWTKRLRANIRSRSCPPECVAPYLARHNTRPLTVRFNCGGIRYLSGQHPTKFWHFSRAPRSTLPFLTGVPRLVTVSEPGGRCRLARVCTLC